MNKDALIRFIENELEFIHKKSITRIEGEDEASLKWIADKTRFLKDVVSCANFTPDQVATAELPYATKEVILGLFDQKTLIYVFLQKRNNYEKKNICTG